MRNKILLEAGYRCAVPTCRYPITENAHIVAWSKTHNNKASNLIPLCPNCHTRYDSGEIPVEAIRHYKKQLEYLSQLYTKFELDVLDYLKINRRAIIPTELMIKRLLDEGLVQVEIVIMTQGFEDGEEIPVNFSVILTERGKDLLKTWSEIDSRDQGADVN